MLADKPDGLRLMLGSHGAGEREPAPNGLSADFQHNPWHVASTHTNTAEEGDKGVCVCVKAVAGELAPPVKCLSYKQVAPSLIPRPHVYKNKTKKKPNQTNIVAHTGL